MRNFYFAQITQLCVLISKVSVKVSQHDDFASMSSKLLFASCISDPVIKAQIFVPDKVTVVCDSSFLSTTPCCRRMARPLNGDIKTMPVVCGSFRVCTSYLITDFKDCIPISMRYNEPCQFSVTERFFFIQCTGYPFFILQLTLNYCWHWDGFLRPDFLDRVLSLPAEKISIQGRNQGVFIWRVILFTVVSVSFRGS